MNTKFNNNKEVDYQTEQSSSCKEWSDHSKYEIAECLFTERETLTELVNKMEESFNYHLDTTFNLWGVEEYELDFEELLNIDKIEDLDVEVIKSKLNLIKEDVDDSNDIESLEELFKEVEEIELSIRTIKMLIGYLLK